MEPIRYVDALNEKYGAMGFPPYKWSVNEDAPWTPLAKPLSDCTVAMLVSGGISHCSAAPFDLRGRGCILRHRSSRVGRLKADQDFVRGVLQPCIRLVELTSCLAGQLTKLVAVGHMRECPKNQIGTHCESLLLLLHARTVLLGAAGAAGDPNKRNDPQNSIVLIH